MRGVGKAAVASGFRISALTAVTSAGRRSAITQGNHDDAAPLHVVQEVAHDASGFATSGLRLCPELLLMHMFSRHLRSV